MRVMILSLMMLGGCKVDKAPWRAFVTSSCQRNGVITYNELMHEQVRPEWQPRCEAKMYEMMEVCTTYHFDSDEGVRCMLEHASRNKVTDELTSLYADIRFGL